MYKQRLVEFGTNNPFDPNLSQTVVIRNGKKLPVFYDYGLSELNQSPTPCDTDSRKRSLLLYQTTFIFALVINQLLHDSLV